MLDTTITAMETSEKIKIGISTCLTGENVRYDGGHKLDRYLIDTLGQYIDYVPVCPEVECGMPIPREALRLVGNPASPRLVTSRTGGDKTDQMMTWAKKRIQELEKENLCGFIFQKGSPSSGMERIKVYSDKGIPTKTGVGLFARAFMEHFPFMPVEDDGRLHDPVLRENFIVRIFAHKRWQELVKNSPSRGGLVDFHTDHKLLFMSHSPKHLKELGVIPASPKSAKIEQMFSDYYRLMMTALKLRATHKKHVNVLQHILGYFKKQLTPDEKQEFLSITDRYHRGLVPLIVPITLVNHYVRKFGEPYLSRQVYLNPHPAELALRNHV